MKDLYSLRTIGELFGVSTDKGFADGYLKVSGTKIVGEALGLRLECRLDEHETLTVRKDIITNLSKNPITIRSAFSRFSFVGGEYDVYTQYSGWESESMGAWQPLVTAVEASVETIRTSHDAAPFTVLFSRQTNRGVAFHLLPHGLWKMRVKRYARGSEASYVTLECGPNERNFSYTLAPGEALELPTLLFYTVSDKVGLDAWKLHRYCNEVYPKPVMPVFYNSWMYRFDRFTPELLMEQVDTAADLGFEYFVIDAGWFGCEGSWFPTVGDWFERPESALKGRMSEVSEKVLKRGMKFGLWLEIERAAFKAEIIQKHPEYFILYERPNNSDTYYLDFRRKDAYDYLRNTIDGLIEKYHISFFKFDFNDDLCTDLSGHAFKEYFDAYKRFITSLGEDHPDLYIENCSAGGQRINLGYLPEFHGFWLSDNHSPHTCKRIYKDMLLRMPPNRLERVASIMSIPDFKPVYDPPYSCEMIIAAHDATWKNLIGISEGWLDGYLEGTAMGYSCDLNQLTDHLREHIKEKISEFKENRSFYQKSECRTLTDTDSELVLEYTDKNFDRLVLMIYSELRFQEEIEIYPVVDPNASYRFNDQIITGKELTEKGLIIPFNFRQTYNVLRFELTKI